MYVQGRLRRVAHNGRFVTVGTLEIYERKLLEAGVSRAHEVIPGGNVGASCEFRPDLTNFYHPQPIETT